MDFILERLRKRFGSEERGEEEGFEDMDYIIGNSSALDRGEVPTPLDERIGYASTIGGSVMELKVSNPATFTLEREDIINTLEQLGIDINLHSDMNAGYASAAKSGAEGYGYETIEQYFTDYLQELAHFKKEVKEKGSNGPLFKVGRINPHISTTPMPSLNERMARDVGVDPFGFAVDEYDDQHKQMRNEAGQNIWKNKEFMRKLYEVFLKQVVDQKWQLFTGRQGLFTQYSDKFDNIYRDTMRKACDDFYENQVNDPDNDDLQTRISLVSTAARADVGVQTEWLNKIDDDLEDERLRDISATVEREDNPTAVPINIDKISDLNNYLPPNVRVTRINALSEAIYRIKNGDWVSMGSNQGELSFDDEEKEEEVIKILLEEIGEKLDRLWRGKNGKENEDKFLITVQGKLRALANNMDVEVDRIRNRALGKTGVDHESDREKSWDIDEAAQEVMAGNPDFFDRQDGENRYDEFLRALLGNFGREIWKESNLFYYIIPAWMSEAENNYGEEHHGWDAPKFIWEELMGRWKSKEDVEIDLKNPWGPDSDEKRYFELLQNNNEFQMDVAAAVGCCYVWAHFTQKKSSFDLKGRDFGFNEEEAAEVQGEGWTWIEWMNRFGIGVNMETMAGSPQQKFKVWRPKDISIAAHAVNLTARKKLSEEGKLGGLEEIHTDLDGCPVKFTIDMEHVASIGAPPMHEMELFIEQEQELAENSHLNIDPDKPIAKILRQIHLMDPGVEAERGTYHGAIERGNTLLYEWLYRFVEEGFARNEEETATILFELAEHKAESSYVMRLMMDLIQIGIKPEELDPARVDPSTEPESEEEALIARFYGIERENYAREWAKIEEHAFDPLEGLLEAAEFDHTYSKKAALDNENRAAGLDNEEYK